MAEPMGPPNPPARRGRRGRTKDEGLPPELIAAIAGEGNYLWKGQAATYHTIQAYMGRHYPRAGVCEQCGNAGRTQYSLIEGRTRTRDRCDYRELCRRCVIALGSPPPDPLFTRNAVVPVVLAVPAPTSAPAVICNRGATWRLWPCKIWTGRIIQPGGYGRRYVRGTWPQPQTSLVHREALAKKLGRPINPGMDALHHCDTPPCHEPQHVYEGTDVDNARDRSERKRGRNQYGGQVLTEAEKAEIRMCYAMEDISHVKLGLRYGISPATIRRVVTTGQ